MWVACACASSGGGVPRRQRAAAGRRRALWCCRRCSSTEASKAARLWPTSTSGSSSCSRPSSAASGCRSVGTAVSIAPPLALPRGVSFSAFTICSKPGGQAWPSMWRTRLKERSVRGDDHSARAIGPSTLTAASVMTEAASTSDCWVPGCTWVCRCSEATVSGGDGRADSSGGTSRPLAIALAFSSSTSSRHQLICAANGCEGRKAQGGGRGEAAVSGVHRSGNKNAEGARVAG